MVQILASIHAHAGNPSGDQGLTFAAFLPKYLTKLTGKNLIALDRPKTILNLHLLPFFGIRPLHTIRLEDGVAYIAHRRTQGCRRHDREGMRRVTWAAQLCGGE